MSEALPDGPGYEDLDLLNFGTEYDLAGAAIEYAQAALPEWEPREGNTEVVLIESLAMMLGVEVVAIQSLPERLLELLMGLYGVTRDPGTPATGRVSFEVTASNPIQVIPKGTLLRYRLEATGETIDVETVESLSIITTEASSGAVSVIAADTGVEANGVPAGASLDVVDNLTFINRASLVEPLLGGTGEESDTGFYARSAAALGRLNSTLVLPAQFQYAALSEPGVGRAKVFDRHDPAAAPGVVSAGHLTVAVADKAGLPLPVNVGEELEGWLASQALASLSIHVIDPTYTSVDLAVTVRATPGSTEAQVRDAVTTALQAYASPATWDWADTLTQYGLIATLGALPQVKTVVNVPADQALPGTAPLPTPGTITVTVTA